MLPVCLPFFLTETHKPSQLASLTKSTSKRARREDHVRLRALNGLLYKALTELLCTPEVSQELCDLNVELSKVGLGAREGLRASRLCRRLTVRKGGRDAQRGRLGIKERKVLVGCKSSVSLCTGGVWPDSTEGAQSPVSDEVGRLKVWGSGERWVICLHLGVKTREAASAVCAPRAECVQPKGKEGQ